MATLNELFETYVNDNYAGVMSEAAIVKAYELLLGLTGDFPAKDERVQFWVDQELTVSEFVDTFLAAAARLSEDNAAAWGETTAGRTAVVTAAQDAAASATSLEDIGASVATVAAAQYGPFYTVTADVAEVDESGTVTLTIAAAEGDDALAEGTELAYTISGVESADVTTALTGTATIGADGTATVTVSLVEDLETEGTETLTLTVGGSSVDVAVTDSSISNTNDTRTFEVASATGTVTEGSELTFTVTASEASSVDQTLTYSIAGVAVEGVGGAATPVDDLGILNGTVTILAGETTGTFTLTPAQDSQTEGLEGFTVSILGSDNTAVATSANVLIKDPDNAGQSFTLTTGVDEFTGGAGDDIFNAVVDATTTTNATVTALDQLAGGAGNDTLRINNTATDTSTDATDLSLATITGIETITLQSVYDISNNSTSNSAASNEVDFSSISGLTTLNTTKSVNTLLNAASTTDVNVSGATGLISVLGGNDVTVTDTTADKAISVGNAAASTGSPAGAITVTDSDNSGTAAITVTGGTDVTVTTTADATSGNIVVGHATNGQASGAVSVTQNTTSDASAAVIAGDVTVTGGSTIDITANITNTATVGNNTDITAGTYTAIAGDATTAVTITQNNTATDLAAVVTGNSTETASVKFGVLKSGDAITISTNGDATADAGELTFTAAKDLTAEEVAAAFANLTENDTQTASQVTNGVFTGSIAGWTSAAASGDTVVFTSTTADSNIANNLDTALTNTSTNSVDATVTTTNGSAGSTVASQDVTATDGTVVVDDNATASVTTITLDGFNGATLGGGGGASLDALTTLSLTDGAGVTTLTTAKTSLTVALDGMAAASSLDVDGGGASVTNLTINTSGDASDVDLTATVLTDATIAASADLDLSGSTFGALANVTVTGAGDVALGDIKADAESISAASATGAISATVDGTSATVATGSGDDTITLATGTALTKAIDLGAGDDTVVFDAVVTGSTAALNAGTGTDTLSMTVANAAALGLSTQSFYTNFERLTLNDAAGDDDNTADTVTIDLENLGLNSYVTSNGTVLDTTAAGNSDTLVLDNMANNGTLEIVASAAGANTKHTVNVKDAGASAADTFNVKVESTGDTDFGTVTLADVETVNLEVSDPVIPTLHTHTVALDVNAATTLNVSATAIATVSTVNAASLVTVDASATQNGFIYTADGALAQTVTGGAGDDELTASGSQDVLIGGEGSDTLTGASLTTLTGGAGNDTFVVNIPTNVNSYSTITDLSSGDVLQLTAGETFVATAVTLADTAVFQDYANAAVNQLAEDDEDAAWFQHGGNTYVVINDDQTNANDLDFENGVDAIIQITGLVDLSTASYNQTNGTLEIA